MTGRTTALNQVQKINEVLRGSRITLLGSGGFTEAQVGTGVVSTYACPVGKKALVKGTFTAVALGTNTNMGARVFDNTTGFASQLCILTALGQASFTVILTSNERIQFFGDNAANDGTAACTISIQEAPV